MQSIYHLVILKSVVQLMLTVFCALLLPFPQVAKEFGFNSNGFAVYLNRNKTDEIVSQSKTLSILKIK